MMNERCWLAVVAMAVAACRLPVTPDRPPARTRGTAVATLPSGSELPVPATLARPHRIWRTLGPPTLGGAAWNGLDLLFVITKESAVMARELQTGRVRWEASLGGGSASDFSNSNIFSVGETVVAQAGEIIAGFRASDGKRLWRREEPCRAEAGAGEYLALRCYGSRYGEMHVANVRDGRRVRRFTVRDEFALGQTFVIVHEESGVLLRWNLDGAQSWRVSTKILKGERRKVGVHGDAIIVAGIDTQAFDVNTGALLWQELGTGDDRGPFAAIEVDRDRAFVMRPDAVTVREVRSGRVVARVPIPPFLSANVNSRDVSVHADGDTMALVMRAGMSVEGLIVTWNGGRAVALDHPMVIGKAVALMGGVLAFVNGYDGITGAYDLHSYDLPLASLPPAAAVAAAAAEMTGEERLLCGRLSQLSHLGAYWVEIAGRPPHELWPCAMDQLARSPQAGAGEMLRRVFTQREAKDITLRALAQDDDLETSNLVAALVRMPRPASPPERARWEQRASSAYEQLWRTGRTAALGLCRPAVRSVPELSTRAADGSIGTAHPLMFQDIAPHGEWTHICQARTDSDNDGQIDLIIGHHGEPLGDEVTPYLVAGSGPGWAIDEFIAGDPTGRFVAVRDGACLALVDVKSAQSTTLPDADLRDNGHFGHHRAVSFDASGARMLYLRGGERTTVVVRELASGQEHSIDAGAGYVVAARFDPDGRWIRLTVAPSGKATTFFTTLAPRRCRGGAASYSVFGSNRPTILVERTAPSTGGPFKDQPDLVASFGDRVLVRGSDGEIVSRDGQGREIVMAPASCRGRLVHADPGRDAIVVVCQAKGPDEASHAFISGGGRLRDLGEATLPDQDVWTERPTAIVGLHFGHVDMNRGEIVPAPPLALAAVRPLNDWQQANRGIYAQRGDGAVLKVPERSPKQRSFDVLAGPLRWERR
jgi:hypothetical protein